MNIDLNDLIFELNDLLPKLRELIQSNGTFERYILPSIIAGIISFAGILINNSISVYVFRKKRSLEYGKFYLPYLSYLKDIVYELDLLPIQKQNVALLEVICLSNKLKTQCDITNLHKILESLKQIDDLFSENTYYIINKRINNDVLKVQTLIVFIKKYENRNISQDQCTIIKEKIERLDLDIRNHVKDIEKNS